MNQILEPTECPCCSYPLTKINDQLFCKNTACSAQLNKKIEHFAKALNIKGLGPKTVELLNLSDIIEVYYLDIKDTETILGKTLANKLLAEIEKSKDATLDMVLAAFSIPLIGTVAAKKLAAKISSIDDITEDVCKEAGLGDKATSNIITWLSDEYISIKEFLPFRFKQFNTNSGKLVCITGKLKSYPTKDEAYKVLIEHGYRIADNVTKDVDILVNESGVPSSKTVKAEKYGITITTDLTSLL